MYPVRLAGPCKGVEGPTSWVATPGGLNPQALPHRGPCDRRKKAKGKAVTITHHVRNANWGTTVTEDIVPGATLHDITHKQLGAMAQEAIDAIDCTIVFA